MFPFRYPNPLPEASMSSQSSEHGSNNPESSRTSPNEYKPTTQTINHFGVINRIANMSTYQGSPPVYPGMHFDQQTQNQFFARTSETPESKSEASASNQEVRADSTSQPCSFKNYLKNSKKLPAYFNDAKYMKFREVKMAEILASKGGRTVPSNKISEQGSSEGDGDGSSNPKKDPAYYEQQMRSNAAAEKSRDKRRIPLDELAFRNEFLENENAQLRAEVNAIREQQSERHQKSDDAKRVKLF